MKRFFLVLGILFCFSLLVAQTGSYNPNTGDTEFDTFLTELNAGAKEEQQQFKAEMSVEFNVSIATINSVFQIDGIQPADVFLLFSIAQETKKPVDQLIPLYKKNRGKGWGLILKEMKIHTKAGREILKNRVSKKNQMLKEKKKMMHEKKIKDANKDKKGPKDKKK